MSNEHDLPFGADWIPDVLPDTLWTGETEYQFGNGRQMSMLRLAEVEVGLTWQDLMRSYLFLGIGIHMGGQIGDYQFMRRVGEDEKALTLDEKVDWEGTTWDEQAKPRPGEDNILFRTRRNTPYTLQSIADAQGVPVATLLERVLDVGLRMSYELRHTSNISYFLKTKGKATRINELRLGGSSSKI